MLVTWAILPALKGAGAATWGDRRGELRLGMETYVPLGRPGMGELARAGPGAAMSPRAIGRVHASGRSGTAILARPMTTAIQASGDLFETLRRRGFVQQSTNEDGLVEVLKRGPVTLYAGFDPTAASLHVGHLLPIMGLAHFARAGHRVIAVLGGGTAMVGDPSGKTEMRQLLTPEAIGHNRLGIEAQLRRQLDGHGSAATVVDNAAWLAPLRYLDFLRDIGRHFSVNRMLSAESYKVRMATGLSFIEFNYQLLQAYDFLVLSRTHGCSLQVGGDDQWSNMLAGVDLIRRLEQREAFALTFPLITTAAGAKMGKTASGAVWLSAERTSVFDFFQYFVNVDDRDVERLLKLFTFLPLDEVDRLAALKGAEIREAKRALAHAVTAIVHGSEAADEAQRAAGAAFGGRGDEDAEVPTFVIPPADLGGGAKVVDVLVAAGLAGSKSIARRLVAQGGVRVGDRKVESVEATLGSGDVPSAGVLLHAGKKHVRRIVSG
jgi:tyrosyl-tRNA synthetase